MEPVAIVSKVVISKSKVNNFFDDFKSKVALEMLNIMKNNECFGDALIIQYNEQNQSLYFIYWLELRNPEDMEETKAFQIFKNIANYKDIDTIDYIAFSSSAPNFMEDPIWVTYKISINKIKKLESNKIPKKNMLDMNQAIIKYIYEPSEKNIDSFDDTDDFANPYSIFLNEFSINKILLDEYNKISN